MIDSLKKIWQIIQKNETSPFVCELGYGNSNDGYWKDKDMIEQLEDCVDVLKCIYPQFDFIFLFEHSNGHNCLQPNSLSIHKINIQHAGNQPKMRDAFITANLLGPYHNNQS